MCFSDNYVESGKLVFFATSERHVFLMDLSGGGDMLISIGKQIAVRAMTTALGIIRDVLRNRKSTSHVRRRRGEESQRPYDEESM